MDNDTKLNEKFAEWILNALRGIIECDMSEDKEKIRTILSVNDFINSLEARGVDFDISNLLDSDIIDKIFNEIKDIMQEVLKCI